MDAAQSEEQQRLRQFIDRTQESYAAFARETGVAKQLLNRYLNEGSTPAAVVLKKFWNAGLSTEWYLYGVGSMYANNDKGRELLRIHVSRDWMATTMQQMEQVVIDTLNRTARVGVPITDTVEVLGTIQDMGGTQKVPVMNVHLQPQTGKRKL